MSGAGGGVSRVGDAVRLAVGTLTVLPVRPPTRLDRRVAGLAMALAPVVGLVLGGAGGLVLWAAGLVWTGWLPALLAVAAVGVLTRLLHWDGLADVADGFGSGRRGADALAVMRRGDIGPFGVFAVLVVLGVQVGALAGVPPSTGAAVLVAGVVLGRWALAVACRGAVPAARADGLGVVVAGSVTRALLAASAALALLAALVPVGVAAAAGVDAVAWFCVGIGLAGLAVGGWAWAVSRYAVHRLGGITGDVLGAVLETSTALALLVLSAVVAAA